MCKLATIHEAGIVGLNHPVPAQSIKVINTLSHKYPPHRPILDYHPKLISYCRELRPLWVYRRVQPLGIGDRES
jgi:hypothetical protein